MSNANETPGLSPEELAAAEEKAQKATGQTPGADGNIVGDAADLVGFVADGGLSAAASAVGAVASGAVEVAGAVATGAVEVAGAVASLLGGLLGGSE